MEVRMRRKTGVMLVAVWAVLLAIIVSSAQTIFASGSGMIRRYGRLETIRKTLADAYYEEVDEDVLIEGAIRGMAASLQDPYTFYYTPDEMQRHNAETGGEYHGVGMLVQNNAQGLIEVIRVYENSPAECGGICAGDLLLAVDGVNVYGSNEQALNEAVKLIQGEYGTEVVVSVRRGDDVLDLTLVRGEVQISNISSSMMEDRIGYIAISQFAGNAVEGFKTALADLHNQGMRGLVVDLRNNPGGLLDDVVAIADMILPEGVVVYTEDRAGNRIDYTSDGEYDAVPMTVLINGMSASASEIFAAAVQDYERGTIVGTRSYGKGVVQTLVQFSEDGAGFQYTSATYFTPGGKCIHGYGVTPDIVVEASDEYAALSGLPEPSKDPQLQEAIKSLLNK